MEGVNGFMMIYDAQRSDEDECRIGLQFSGKFLRIWSIIRAGEADLERPEEAAGGDGHGAPESGGAAEGRAVHAEPAQAPAGAWREV